MEDKIISMAKALGRALLLDERSAELGAACKANDEDEELQGAIKRYGELKSELAKALDSGNSGDEISRLNDETGEQYEKIMQSAGMLRYAAAKKEADELLNWIFAIITTAMNGG
ncbi:MAG: YlbF family regulator, partial [Oscillospiraceae bacterium]|nr:YlbF family regulator [Oscillospiraceae bacterium]